MDQNHNLKKLISVLDVKSVPLLMNDESSYTSLLESIDDARIVLIGI